MFGNEKDLGAVGKERLRVELPSFCGELALVRIPNGIKGQGSRSLYRLWVEFGDSINAEVSPSIPVIADVGDQQITLKNGNIFPVIIHGKLNGLSWPISLAYFLCSAGFQKLRTQTPTLAIQSENARGITTVVVCPINLVKQLTLNKTAQFRKLSVFNRSLAGHSEGDSSGIAS